MEIPRKFPKVPPDVQERLDRGRQRMEEDAGLRNVCLEFYRGNQYLWLSETNKLYDQRGFARQQLSGEEYKHRVWQTRNIIRPTVDSKVSGATQRIPSYEVLPSTKDHEDWAAASLSERIALAGYDIWNIRKAAEKAIRLCLVADESFAWPYFDPDVGPYVEDEEGNQIGQGEIKVAVFSRNEVFWEPGVDFEESEWYSIEHARSIEKLKKAPGFLGLKLKPDADTNAIAGRSAKVPSNSKNLVMVTEYFERPCAQYPEGRRLTFANGKLIFPEEPYPLRNAQNEVIDAPLLHRLTFSADPDSEKALGIVRDMLDPQRTLNDCENKAIEWKNVSLNPQILAPEGSLLNRPTNAPGAIVYYRTLPGMQPPEWRETPPIPPELFQIGDRARGDLGTVAHGAELPPSEVESGKEAEAITASQQLAWDSFLVQLAEWHSRLMRDCLILVQRHYSEPRLVRFRGRVGWESVEDFRGADLRGQTDVRVLPGSLMPRTREAVTQQVMNFAQMGWITPESAMAAIKGGTAENLIDDYEQDLARAHRIIQKLKIGADVLFSEPPRPPFPGEDPGIDPATGQPNVAIPGWMPRPFDNVPLQKAVFEGWMKTSDYETLPEETKQAANFYYAALLDLEIRAAQREAMLQQQQAEQMGMMNATRPPEKPLPSLPSVNGSNES